MGCCTRERPSLFYSEMHPNQYGTIWNERDSFASRWNSAQINPISSGVKKLLGSTKHSKTPNLVHTSMVTTKVVSHCSPSSGPMTSASSTKHLRNSPIDSQISSYVVFTGGLTPTRLKANNRESLRQRCGSENREEKSAQKVPTTRLVLSWEAPPPNGGRVGDPFHPSSRHCQEQRRTVTTESALKQRRQRKTLEVHDVHNQRECPPAGMEGPGRAPSDRRGGPCLACLQERRLHKNHKKC
jgi:hypothetical protein